MVKLLSLLVISCVFSAQASQSPEDIKKKEDAAQRDELISRAFDRLGFKPVEHGQKCFYTIQKVKVNDKVFDGSFSFQACMPYILLTRDGTYVLEKETVERFSCEVTPKQVYEAHPESGVSGFRTKPSMQFPDDWTGKSAQAKQDFAFLKNLYRLLPDAEQTIDGNPRHKAAWCVYKKMMSNK